MATDYTLYTPEKGARLCDALRDKPSIAAACRRLRVSRKTYYNWRKAYPEFAAQADAAREQGFDAAEDKLVERGLKSDTTALIFLLKSWRRDRYGDRQETRHTGTIEHRHTHDLDRLSPEERVALFQLKRKLEGQPA